jgi:multisubunit Na+/H+ antiporter MnhE subunit
VAKNHGRASPAGRLGAWLAWWVVLMIFWVVVDDSFRLDELLAGAGAAALGATLAELAGHQAGIRFRLRARWIVPALRLPWQVVRDTIVVFAALWRRLARGEEPRSGFVAQPVRYGDDSDIDVTRRVLLVAAQSVAPNTFALGLDEERDQIVIHQLVITEGEPAS